MKKIFLNFFFKFLFILRIFSGRFDTSGSMIARSVPEISLGVGFFVTRTRTEELDIQVVGYCVVIASIKLCELV